MQGGTPGQDESGRGIGGEGRVGRTGDWSDWRVVEAGHEREGGLRDGRGRTGWETGPEMDRTLDLKEAGASEDCGVAEHRPKQPLERLALAAQV